MKTIFRFLLCTIILVIGVIYFQPETFAAEIINNYEVVVEIKENGTLDILEYISYDFGLAQRHGIFRDIPFVKENEAGKKYKLTIDIVSVEDSEGAKYPFTTSIDGENLRLKIGDANKYVSGLHMYVINYKVSGALTYFSDHDELYWNILGDAWEVPIKQFSGKVFLPNGVPKNEIKSVCYTGVAGSTESDCFVSQGENPVTINSSENYQLNNGLTLAVSFPKGIVAVVEPEEYQLIDSKVLYALIAGAVLYYIFLPVKFAYDSIKERLRLKNNAKIVSAWFDPPKDSTGKFYTPAETALLLDPKIDGKKVTATLVHLAQRGFLKIHFTKGEGFLQRDSVAFEQLKPIDSSELNTFEKDLMEALFMDVANGRESFAKAFPGVMNFVKNQINNIKPSAENTAESKELTLVSLDLLKRTSEFSKHMVSFKKNLGNRLKLFGDSKKSIKDLENRSGAMLGFGAMTFNIPLILVGVLLERKKQNLTDKGIEQYGFAKSLKNFIDSQNDQYDFQAERQMFFEKLLPYATAFGVEDVWIKRFGDLDLSKSDWITGDIQNYAALSAINNTISSGIQSSMTPTNSSSGFSSGYSGGSSGGGGGGGGGGSW